MLLVVRLALVLSSHVVSTVEALSLPRTMDKGLGLGMLGVSQCVLCVNCGDGEGGSGSSVVAHGARIAIGALD